MQEEKPKDNLFQSLQALTARLHRRFLSRQLDAIFVGLKVAQNSFQNFPRSSI